MCLGWLSRRTDRTAKLSKVAAEVVDSNVFDANKVTENDQHLQCMSYMRLLFGQSSRETTSALRTVHFNYAPIIQTKKITTCKE
jgi:hypothetical protein